LQSITKSAICDKEIIVRVMTINPFDCVQSTLIMRQLSTRPRDYPFRNNTFSTIRRPFQGEPDGVARGGRPKKIMARSVRAAAFGIMYCTLLATVSVFLLTHSKAADDPILELPIDCSLGATCFVQNYVDINPGPGAQDFTCGVLTYNNHKGVDFRIRDLADMTEGVFALAAASGLVRSIRDGVPDGFPDKIGDAQIEGTECGNGIVINHGGGWETQYCHLRNGSVTVKQGQPVEAGKRVALVGMSGNAQFPHLHLSLRREGHVVDPYVGQQVPASCGGVIHPMWSAAAQRALTYRPSGVINAGFTSVTPTLRGIETGEIGEHVPRAGANMIFYVRFFGLQAGDRQRIRVFDPRDELVADTTTAPAQKNKAQWMQYVGRRPPPRGWPSGIYRGRFELLRNGVVALTATPQIEIP
jgi:murein DD-endopeptidase MepM/ murein hydrolase activator NlpD